MSANVLAARDTNAQPKPASSPEKGKEGAGVKSMEYHRQMLQSKLSNGEKNDKYVSPSDAIMSPATQKLSVFRNKHAMKAKPQTLFKSASARKVERVMGGDMFADVPKKNEDEP